MPTLPTVQLYRDSNPGQIIFNVEVNPQALLAQRTSLGAALRIPAALTPVVHNAHPLTLYGAIGLPNEQGGISIPDQPFGRYDQYLEIPMTDEQLARLERARAGQQLVLEIRLRGLAMIGETPVIVAANYAPSLTIPRDEWLRVLEQLDGGCRRLIELPAPPRTDGMWARVSEHLQRASWRLAAGDPGGALSEARTASERLIEAIGADVGRPRQASTDKALYNYASAIASIIATAHKERTGDPYEVVSGSVSLVYSVFAMASETHNGLDRIERLNAELAVATLSALYAYAAQAALRSITAAPPTAEV